MAKTVQLFITCMIDTLYPKIGEAVVRVLQRAGVKVEFPAGQTCCGQPAFNAGMREQARPIAKHTIRVFEQTQGPVVVPSGSCAAMIRHGYLELFAEDAEWLPRARAPGRAHLRVHRIPGRRAGCNRPGRALPRQDQLPFFLPPAARAGRRPPAARAAGRPCTAPSWSSCPTPPSAAASAAYSRSSTPRSPRAMLDRKIENIDASGAPAGGRLRRRLHYQHPGRACAASGMPQRAVYIAEILAEESAESPWCIHADKFHTKSAPPWKTPAAIGLGRQRRTAPEGAHPGFRLPAGRPRSAAPARPCRARPGHRSPGRVPGSVLLQRPANGLIVHRAASAEEAVEIVLEIARARRIQSWSPNPSPWSAKRST